MTKHSYSVEPQRRTGIGDGGFELCLPHQAQRFAVVQLTFWHHGGKKLRSRRTIISFTGPKAERKAYEACQNLIAHSKPKREASPRQRSRPLYGRSLTSEEYHRWHGEERSR